MSESNASLKTLFEQATQLRSQLESLQTTSEQYQTALRSAISKYEECRHLTSHIGLFSPNEAADDISSSDLKYLSIDFYLGDLIPREIGGGPSERKTLLFKSKDAYTRYLSLLDDYELLNEKEKKLYERFVQDKAGFTLAVGSDAVARREAKIARFQHEKELKQKLAYLAQRPELEEDDDSVIRQLRLAELTLHTHETFQALDMLAQELKILAMAPPTPESKHLPHQDTRESGRSSADGYSERLDPSLKSMLRNGKAGPILNKDGRPLQPFTLLDSRQRLQNGVFRPGHNLPTMTIDEYLEEEKRRGGIIEGGGEQPAKEVNEDDHEAADRETMKAREWDEFKEANPKGSGNTLNRG
jgi:immunoglobulin-binding protein 1